MNKEVKFEIDESCEMLVVSINGEVWRTGNLWDFQFDRDVPVLLRTLGIPVEEWEIDYEMEYEYSGDEDE